MERRVYPHLPRHTAITDLTARRRLHPGVLSAITEVSVQVISQHYLHPTEEETWEAVMRYRFVTVVGQWRLLLVRGRKRSQSFEVLGDDAGEVRIVHRACLAVVDDQ